MPTPVRLRPVMPIVSRTSWIVSTLRQCKRYRHANKNSRLTTAQFDSPGEAVDMGAAADMRNATVVGALHGARNIFRRSWEPSHISRAMRLATILPRSSIELVPVAAAPDGTWIELAGLIGREAPRM